MRTPGALVFGGTGAIGSAVADALSVDGYAVLRTTRQSGASSRETLELEPFGSPRECADALSRVPPLDVVVWAQGTNVNDSVLDFDLEAFRRVMDANCTFVAVTLAALLKYDRIRAGARLCVISSIWQKAVRPEKLSYTVSKAALAGLVRSASADLARRGIVINAVLPGVLDTPMARSMLSENQVAAVEAATGFARLPSVAETVSAVRALCAPENTGMTGQSVAVDLGFGRVRLA